MLAWFATEYGSDELAARWVAMAAPDSDLLPWLRVRAAVRTGDHGTATLAMRDLVAAMPTDDGKEHWRESRYSPPSRRACARGRLDVTDPGSPAFMWQTRLPNGISFNSDVEMTTIAGQAVALVGSGLDTTTKLAWLYGYRISDGALLGSVQLSTNAAGTRNKATRPASVDLDLDGNSDLVYIADITGKLHRFAVNGSPDPDNWTRTTLYSGTQEITADPTAAYGPNGNVYVYFGTGAYLNMADIDVMTTQDFICVFDRHDGATVTKSGLANQTSTINVIGSSHGWYYTLNGSPGLRVVERAAVVAETVIFTAFAPTLETCVAGGTSFLYQMRYGDGGNTDSQNSLDDREQTLGGGVASHPVVDLSTGTVVVQSSDATITVTPIASQFQRMNVRAWQENYDHVHAAPAPTVRQ